MITLWRTELASKQKKSFDEVRNVLSERMLERILEKIKEKKLEVGDVKQVMQKIIEGAEFEEAVKIEKINDDELEQEIRKIVKEKPGLTAGAYMGLIIQKLGNNLDKRKAMEILQKIIK